jgi:DNA modification methylase
MSYNIINGNCLDELKNLPDNSVDSIVTDPPYGISFMGKKWDYDVPSVEIWAECLRVLKPGGHLLAFAGTRTQHRMACRIEDAGFEIRDLIMWAYSSGMPKSHNVSKAIDKAAGAEREVVGKHPYPARNKPGGNSLNMSVVGMPDNPELTVPATPEAKQWEGWGTSLKPSLEPITMARKPLEGTVAANVLKYGTGAINIDGCLVEFQSESDKASWRWGGAGKENNSVLSWKNSSKRIIQNNASGRWPANIIHDGSDEVVSLFPDAKSGRSNGLAKTGQSGKNTPLRRGALISRNDSGSAARFFYCAKASPKDRNSGLSDKDNDHPTVKPTDLMCYLCRLVTPPGGTVLDPFMGSGSTGKGAILEGFNFIGMELDPHYCEIAEKRIGSVKVNVTLDEIFT